MHKKSILYLLLTGTGVMAALAFSGQFSWFFETVNRSNFCQVFDTRDNKSDPLKSMVWVEGGAFVMGSDGGYPEEGPSRSEVVQGFWIDTHEVTNAEFRAFVEATGHVTTAEKVPDQQGFEDATADYYKPGAAVFSPPENSISGWWQYVVGTNWQHPEGPASSIKGRDQYPVVQVSYIDALSYAQWMGKDLPTEVQWEYAASLHTPSLSSPITDMAQPAEANTWQGLFPVIDAGDDGYKGLAPVGCFKASTVGLYDMLGNVWEWTTNQYAYASPEASVIQRTLKGGSYLCAPNFCQRYRPEARQGQDINFSTNHIGFRLVLNKPKLSAETQ